MAEETNQLKENPVLEPFVKFFESRGISIPTARAWRRNYQLPVIKIGSGIYMRESDFNQWIEDRKDVMSDVELIVPQTSPRKRPAWASKIKRLY